MYGQLGPGTTLADRYELVKLLGEGGMGEVWKARHVRLDSFVAVKFVRPEAQDRNFRDRFEREAQLAASVKHRNVVTIMDYGETPEGIAYMVMDYLDGEPLTNYVRGAFPTVEVVHIIAMALRGLVAVHTAGIVHRDLKPDNIFLVRDASGVYPKLLDFGISRQTDHSQGKRSAVTTQQGVLLGTPAYMSPEQARGLSDIDRRTDIYSMGVLLYEALAGQLPFDAEHVGDLMVAIISRAPRPLHELCPTLPRALCDVVMKAISRDRDARYQTADAMRVALLEAIGNEQSMMLSERPTPPPGTLPESLTTVGSSLRSAVGSSMNEPFQSIMRSAGQSGQAGQSGTGPRTANTFDESASVATQTLDGTSVDVVIKPNSRRLILIAAALAVLAVFGLAFALLREEPPTVQVTPLAESTDPKPGAAAAPPAKEPVVEAPVVEATPVAPATHTGVSADAGVAQPATAAPNPSATRRVAKRPAKTKSSKILTELDY